jgi:hypothetical protein
VLLGDSAEPTKRKLKWKWKGGDAVAVEDFGDPVAGDVPQYALCIYDSSANAQPLEQLDVPSGPCGESTCWKQAGTGFKYKNSGALPDGIVSALLKSGAAGKGQLKLVGKGSALPMPALSLTEPVTLQFVADNGAGVACWQTSFAQSKVNDDDAYKAKGP